MLVILFGTTADMGLKSRQFFTESGFELIQKYNYVPTYFPLRTRFGERNVVAKSEVLKCDFVYENNGMLVGFNKEQIIDAVRGNRRCLLTTSSETIDFIKQLKSAYGDYVTVITHPKGRPFTIDDFSRYSAKVRDFCCPKAEH